MKPDEEVLSIPRGAKYPSIEWGDFDVYAQGYYEAAETLVGEYWGNGGKEPAFDWVVWPVLFLLHHFIELELKEIIRLSYSIGRSFGMDVENLPLQGTHSLVNLLRLVDANIGKLESRLNLNSKEQPLLSKDERELINDLQKFGEGLRYPWSTENRGGCPTLPQNFVVDIPAVMSLVKVIRKDFLGVVECLAHIEENLSRD
jgi:hypothetical protein